MKRILRKIAAFVALHLSLLTIGATAQIASGGAYTLNQSVITNGGGTSSDALNNYKVEGTSGQPTAGTSATGGSYTVRNGFWTPNPFAPTAASATVEGRVLNLYGRGLQNAVVTLSGGTLLSPRMARTGSFGYFRFEDVEVGQVYILSVQSKRYGFGQNPQIISVLEDVTNIVFQASWIN
jgi:hypothetical protein